MGLFDKLKQTVEDVPRAVPAASEQTTEVVFPKLPDTLEAFKALPQAQLSTPSDTAALTVLAQCFYPENAELSLQMLGFLKGPQPLSAYEKQFIRDRFMGKDYVPRSYFTGAVPANDYTPAEPYTIKVSENPYSYSEQGYAKLYLQSGGAAGLSPAQFSLPDFSVTAEAASHYYFDKQTKDLTLSGTFTFDNDDLWDALPEGCTPGDITHLTLSTGANVTFTEPLKIDLYYLENIDLVAQQSI